MKDNDDDEGKNWTFSTWHMWYMKMNVELKETKK